MTFEAIRTSLRQKCATMPIDGASFRRPMARCTLADCRGMCCYDGVYLDAPNEAAVTVIVQARRAELVAMGLDLPDAVVVDGYWAGVPAGRKTATRPWDATAAVADFPAHFNQTCCVFHLDDGRCGLQVLALHDGVHPWTYKPTPCWLFPISINKGVIQVYDETTDPSRFGSYQGFVTHTQCGRTCADARPAVEVFADELRYLGDIAGRDLIVEIGGQIAG